LIERMRGKHYLHSMANYATVAPLRNDMRHLFFTACVICGAGVAWLAQPYVRDNGDGLTQIVLLAMGSWNIVGLLIPLAVVIIGFIYLPRME
jgi:hypothetical protein